MLKKLFLTNFQQVLANPYEQAQKILVGKLYSKSLSALYQLNHGELIPNKLSTSSI